MSRTILTEQDVERLLADPSADVRAETAAKIAIGFDSGELTAKERRLAEEIFRVMVKDAEVRVRAALAENLKESLAVPHDVAVSLARDVDSVALPVLESSEVLTDRDLVEIIRGQGVAKQRAIATRKSVSEAVSEALVDAGDETALTRLVANPGAEISEGALGRVVDAFGDGADVQEAMVGRPWLPVTIAERLVTLVSEHLKEELAARHELPAALATDLILRSRERATITLSTESDEGDVEVLVKQLRENGRLSASIVLRALCMGDVRFFEAALAELAGVSLMSTRKLIHDSGFLGLQGIYEQARLPAAQLTAVRAAVDVLRETDYDGRAHDRERFSRRLIERVLTHYDDLGVEFESDDLEYLLAKMNELPAEPLDDSA